MVALRKRSNLRQALKVERKKVERKQGLTMQTAVTKMRL